MIPVVFQDIRGQWSSGIKEAPESLIPFKTNFKLFEAPEIFLEAHPKTSQILLDFPKRLNMPHNMSQTLETLLA